MFLVYRVQSCASFFYSKSRPNTEVTAASLQRGLQRSREAARDWPGEQLQRSARRRGTGLENSFNAQRGGEGLAWRTASTLSEAARDWPGEQAHHNFWPKLPDSV
ncbi:hypothetical protein NHX12_029922 [Muraenolepis orangiensis]|uniref:Uncharacterized protein n=1 Tax=Muraenolepis orangiensis TaxID=630683 RepID=A0A9Q0EAR8_9TELE|nr:hypothetical protein NHX12_029922 [Muraenolepis orangiensis]